MNAEVEKIIQKLLKGVEEGRALQKSCKEKYGHGDSNRFHNEMSVLETRLKAMDMVLAEGISAEEELRQYIQSFSGSLGGDRRSIAPPSKSYASLFTARALFKQVEACDSCETRQELENISKAVTEEKKPLLDLVASVKATVSDLSKAMAEYDKQQVQPAVQAQQAVQKPSGVKRVATDHGGLAQTPYDSIL